MQAPEILEIPQDVQHAASGGGHLAKGLAALTVCGATVTSMLGTAAAGTPPPSPSPAGAGFPASAQEALEVVTVTGVRSLLGSTLPQSLENIAQTVNVVSGAILRSQADTRLEEALRNVPGITLNAGEGAARGDSVNIRGFSAFNDFFLDGIRDAGVYTRDSFDLESVEVVKGPSAVLFGRGSTGGAINQVSKAPELTPFAELAAEIGTNAMLRGTADVNLPFGRDDAARVNAMGEKSSVAGRGFVENRRWGLAPAVAFGLGTADTLTLAYLHQQEDDVPDTGIPFVDGRPAPVPIGSDYGLASDRTTSNVDIATARFTHLIGSGASITNTLRYAHYGFRYRFHSPNFGSPASGGQGPPAPGTPLVDILVGRDTPSSSGSETNVDDQLNASARVSTGPMTHRLLAGIEYSRQTAHLARYNNPFDTNNDWIAETPLLDPDPYEPIPGIEPISVYQDTTAYAYSAYATDVIGFTPRFDVVAGVRYDEFAADYDQDTVTPAAHLTLHHVDRLASPRAALEYKPTARQTYYVFYGTSFDPSAEALSLTPKTAGLGPVRARTFEIGAKESVLGGELLLGAALFRTAVDNAQTNDPENPNVTLLEGDERVEGIEVDARGHLGSRWEITAGYTYLDGRTLASGTPADVGRLMPNVPHDELDLWVEYRLARRYEIGFGGQWLAHRYADSAESASIPGYTTVDAMVSYRPTRNLSLQLNGSNLLGRLYYPASYYVSAAENHVQPGPGRSASLTVRFVLP